MSKTREGETREGDTRETIRGAGEPSTDRAAEEVARPRVDGNDKVRKAGHELVEALFTLEQTREEAGTELSEGSGERQR